MHVEYKTIESLCIISIYHKCVKYSNHAKRIQGPSNKFTCINGFHKYTSPKCSPRMLEYGGM